MLKRRSSSVLFQAMCCLSVLASTLASHVQAAIVDTTWNGGTGNWNTASMWSTGVVPNNGTDTYNVFIDGGNTTVNSVVTLDTASSIGTLAIDGGDTLGIANGAYLVVSGGQITDSGTLQINSTGYYTRLYIRGETTLSGSGMIRMSDDPANNFITNWDYGDALINDTGHTIAGSGQLGNNSLPITNKGLINADQSTALSVNSSVVNQGTMQASGGGTLRLAGGGTFTNTGHLIQALDGSCVQLGGGATIVGGTLSCTGSGVFQVVNGDNAVLRGELINNSTLQINSTGYYTRLYIRGETTLSGSGMIRMSDDPANNCIRNWDYGDALTNDTGHTIAGWGQLGNDSLPITNKGLINADQSTALSVNSSVVNQGTMQASGGGTLQLNGGSFSNSGTIAALNGSNVSFTSNATVESINTGGSLTSGVWKAIGTGAISVAGAPHTIDTIGRNATVELSGTNSAFSVMGMPIDASLTAVEGTLNLLDGRTLDTTDSLTNEGVLGLGNAARLNVFGDFAQSASGLLDFDIFGIGGAEDFGQLHVLSNASVFGELRVEFRGYSPVVGDSWTLITTDGTLTPHDLTTCVLGLSTGVQVTETFTDHTYELTITAVPEPSTVSLLILGACGLAVFAGRRRL